MSSTNSLVSCVVPVYNGERFLGEAIDSILAQTYQPTEIIVVDDGSTDRTPDVIAQYAGRVTSARQTNAGAAAARNHGISLAHGEFIAFLDADDLWHEEKLAVQLDRFEKRPELGYCLTYMQNFWVEELKEEAQRLQGHELTKPQPGTISTFVVRRSSFDTVGLLNTDYMNRDYHDWMLRADGLGIRRETLSDVLLSRRIHDTNISRQRPREEFFDIIKRSLDSRRGKQTS